MSNMAQVAQEVEAVKARLDKGDETFGQLQADVASITTKLEEMRTDLAAVKDIVVAWNNVKGFVQTINILSIVFSGILKVAALLGLVYLAGKLGDWTKLWDWLIGR